MKLFLPRVLTVVISEAQEVAEAKLEAADYQPFALARGGCDLEIRPASGTVKIKPDKVTVTINLALLTRKPLPADGSDA